MKKSLVVFFLMSAFLTEAQKKFTSKASITQSYTISIVDSVQSILFIYKGDVYFTRKYINMSKRLKKKLRKRFNVGFNYEMDIKKAKPEDVVLIPRKRYDKNKYDLICSVLVYDLEAKRMKYGQKIIHSYKINLEIMKPNSDDLVEFAQLEVESYYHAFENNKAIVGLINKILTE